MWCGDVKRAMLAGALSLALAAPLLAQPGAAGPAGDRRRAPLVAACGAVDPSCIPPEVRREFRGMWVASVSNIDWPSKPRLASCSRCSTARRRPGSTP